MEDKRYIVMHDATRFMEETSSVLSVAAMIADNGFEKTRVFVPSMLIEMLIYRDDDNVYQYWSSDSDVAASAICLVLNGTKV